MTNLESMSSEIIKLLKQTAPWFSLDDSKGDVIQCPPSALCQGRFYVMGFNPGVSTAHDDQSAPKSLRETTQALVSANANATHPLSRDWPRGWSNLTKLAQALKVEDWQHDLFVTNLFPDSSGGVSAWLREHGGRRQHLEYVRKIWPLHQLFLSIVRPQFVIVHGQGSRDSAFRYLWEYLVSPQKKSDDDWNQTMADATQTDDPSIKSFTVAKLGLGKGEPLSDVTFIGIRHLSRSQSCLDVMTRLIPQ